jgi:pyruvate dehydrogenase E2 component (dihydrolipoamide acetyltransferase)
MESGTIVRWLKTEGEQVAKGEPLYELDTDKVTQEVEAEASGVLLKIAVTEGEVEVGRTIGFIGKEGESVAAVEAPAAPKPKEAAAPASKEAQREPEPQTTNGRVKASPLARRLARERGIDLSSIRGTGPDGRIVAQDVETPAAAPAQAAAPVSGDVTSQPLTNIRKTIARRLTEAWTVPAFMLTVSADMTRAKPRARARRSRDGHRPAHARVRAGARPSSGHERAVHGGRAALVPERERRHRRRRAARPRRPGGAQRRAAVAHADRAGPRRSRRART